MQWPENDKQSTLGMGEELSEGPREGEPACKC